MTDWKKLKHEYITSKISYRELSEKYGVGLSMVEHRGAKEKWTELRKEMAVTIAKKAQEKAAEKTAETMAEVSAIKSRVQLRLMEMIESALPTVEPEDTDRLRKVVQSYKDMCDIGKAPGLQEDTGGGGVVLIPEVKGGGGDG